MTITGLVDSFPIVMARHSRGYHVKVTPEYARCGYCSSKQLHDYGVKLHLIGDHRANTLLMPRYAGLTDAATHDIPAFEQVMYHLSYREIYADKAYDHLSRRPELHFTLLTPVKKKKAQGLRDTADDWLSRAVSSVRQPIESLFNWIEQKTSIQCASKVRSSNDALSSCLRQTCRPYVHVKCFISMLLIRIILFILKQIGQLNAALCSFNLSLRVCARFQSITFSVNE